MDTCPKCQHALAQPTPTICPHCGVVFEKYLRYHADRNRPAPMPSTRVEFAPTPSADWLSDTYADSEFAFWGRALLLALFALWSWILIVPPIPDNAAGSSFLHLVNLPFHEAGHLIFRPFGAFVTSLGGTLGQLLMPTICMATLFIKTRDPFGAALCLWWLGENFLDIAPYIDDARAGQLPLLGGNFGHSAPYGFHDWEYLLTESGQLAHDHAIAKFSKFVGSLTMLAALAGGSAILVRQRAILAARR